MANGCVAAIRKGCELYKEVKGTVAAAQKTVKEVTAIAEEVGGFFGFFKKKKPQATAPVVAPKAKKAEPEVWDENKVVSDLAANLSQFFKVQQQLADSTMGVLRDIANKRLTQISVSEQSTEGQKAVAELVKQNTSLFRLPSFINVLAAAGNKAISEYEKALGVKTMKTLTEAMKNPQSAANLLDALPVSEKNRVTQLFTNPSSLRTLTQSVAEQQQD